MVGAADRKCAARLKPSHAAPVELERFPPNPPSHKTSDRINTTCRLRQQLELSGPGPVAEDFAPVPRPHKRSSRSCCRIAQHEP